MRPKDIRGSLPEYFHDFLFDSVAEGYCQSCWIQLSEWNSVFAFTFFYKAKAHYFLRWCFRVPSLELIYLLLRCPGGGKEIGTYLYHITISWSVEWIGGWGISCDHAVLLNCFFVGPQWAHGWLKEACLWYDWYQTGPPEPSRCFPLLPKPRPANHAERTPAEQPREQWGAAKPAICIYTLMQHTNTHARYFHKCGGGIGKQRAKRRGINHDTHTVCSEIRSGIVMSFVFRKQKKPSCSHTLTLTFSLSNFT